MPTSTLKPILFVEDEPDVQVVARLALEVVGGFVIEICGSGRDAPEKAAIFAPDLLLLDLYMPGCSSKEIAEVIRQQETYVSVPIVFLSSETDPGLQLGAMLQGGDDFLTKPISPEHLIKVVEARAQLR